jgi:hypothetical protein
MPFTTQTVLYDTILYGPLGTSFMAMWATVHQYSLASNLRHLGPPNDHYAKLTASMTLDSSLKLSFALKSAEYPSTECGRDFSAIVDQGQGSSPHDLLDHYRLLFSIRHLRSHKGKHQCTPPSVF